jgi:hypothetical protein
MTQSHLTHLAAVAMSITMVAGLAIPGCANESGDKTILVLNNLFAVSQDNKCVIAPSEDSAGRSTGVWSLDEPNSYLLFPLVKNLATDPDGSLLSQRTFFAKGARIAVSSSDPAVQSAIGAGGKYTQLSSFSVTPNGGLAAVGLPLIPARVGALIAPTLSAAKPTAQLVATIEIFGLLGGGEVTSQPFDFPIEACVGCSGRNVGSCASLPTDFKADLGNPCNPLQDGAVDCCISAAGPVCPAAKPMMPAN